MMDGKEITKEQQTAQSKWFIRQNIYDYISYNRPSQKPQHGLMQVWQQLNMILNRLLWYVCSMPKRKSSAKGSCTFYLSVTFQSALAEVNPSEFEFIRNLKLLHMVLFALDALDHVTCFLSIFFIYIWSRKINIETKMCHLCKKKNNNNINNKW